MDDPRPRRDDAEVLERLLRPAQQLVTLAISLVLEIDVLGERHRGAESIDLNGVIDDEIGRHQGIDAGDIAAELGHGVSHRRQIDDGWHPGEILEHDPPG